MCNSISQMRDKNKPVTPRQNHGKRGLYVELWGMKLRYVCLERSKSSSKSISMAFFPSTSPLRSFNIWTGSFSFIPPFPSSLFSCSTLPLSSAYLHNFHMPACHNPLFHVLSPVFPSPQLSMSAQSRPCNALQGNRGLRTTGNLLFGGVEGQPEGAACM